MIGLSRRQIVTREDVHRLVLGKIQTAATGY
jgi:hypothetical protein